MAMIGVEEIAAITSQQAGFVSSAQAARIGVAPRALAALANAGVLDRELRGVFRVRAAPTPPDPELLAAWTLLAGERLPWDPEADGQPPVVISHTSAATLHELGVFPIARPTFIVDRRRHDPPSGLYRTFRLPLAADEWTRRTLPAGIQVALTTAERTLVDLAWAEADPDHVLDAFDAALRHRTVDSATLRRVLARRWRHGGRGTPTWFARAVEHAA